MHKKQGFIITDKWMVVLVVGRIAVSRSPDMANKGGAAAMSQTPKAAVELDELAGPQWLFVKNNAGSFGVIERHGVGDKSAGVSATNFCVTKEICDDAVGLTPTTLWNLTDHTDNSAQEILL